MKKVITKKDKEILDKILLFISDEDRLEDECADFVERATDGRITATEFHRWITKVSVQ